MPYKAKDAQKHAQSIYRAQGEYYVLALIKALQDEVKKNK